MTRTIEYNSDNENADKHSTEQTQIETLTVNPDDIIEALRYNNGPGHNQHTAVIRIYPPFNTDMEASIYYHDETRYPADANPKPIHVHPSRFVEPGGLNWPVRGNERVRVRGEMDDPTEEEVKKYVQASYDVWEDDVRGRLTDELQSNPHNRTAHLDGITINWTSK